MMIALLSVVLAAHADAFHPWALNDSKAFVFPRIAEKRNRARRERLAATLRNDADAIAAVGARHQEPENSGRVEGGVSRSPGPYRRHRVTLL